MEGAGVVRGVVLDAEGLEGGEGGVGGLVFFFVLVLVVVVIIVVVVVGDKGAEASDARPGGRVVVDFEFGDLWQVDQRPEGERMSGDGGVVIVICRAEGESP